MSDFDAVLERLVTDPAFTSALSADPAAALAGYELSADEVELLRSQVSADAGGDRTVEVRTSKASMMGLLSPLSGLGLGGADPQMLGRAVPHTGFESLDGHQAGWIGPGDAGTAHAGWIGPGDSGMADLGGHYGAPDAGPAEAVAHGGEGHYGPAAGTGPGGSVLGDGDQIDPDYHHHIDANGDGKWDQYVAGRHTDGSVDVYEDRHHDGLVDFIGHDRNGDGILESADYDENFDGVADTHMADTNGDGWMDTRGPEPAGA